MFPAIRVTLRGIRWGWQILGARALGMLELGNRGGGEQGVSKRKMNCHAIPTKLVLL